MTSGEPTQRTEHDLVEGPPEERGEPWWTGAARGLGVLARSVADGASRVASIFRGAPPAPETARLTRREQLDAALAELSQRVSGYGSEGVTALADDDEFWKLLRRIQRLGRPSGPKMLAARRPEQERSAPPASEEEPVAGRPKPERTGHDAAPPALLPAQGERAGGEDFLKDVIGGEGGESDEAGLEGGPAVEEPEPPASKPRRRGEGDKS